MGRLIYCTILAAVMAVVVLFGVSQNVADVSRETERLELAAVAAVELPMANDWVHELGASTNGDIWADEVLWDYGLELPDGVTIWITDNENCGSIRGGYGTGGGCYSPDTKMIRISPTLVGTDAGRITVLHEYAHALGYMDECAAEAYAHSLFETYLYGYPECSPAWQE